MQLPLSTRSLLLLQLNGVECRSRGQAKPSWHVREQNWSRAPFHELEQGQFFRTQGLFDVGGRFTGSGQLGLLSPARCTSREQAVPTWQVRQQCWLGSPFHEREHGHSLRVQGLSESLLAAGFGPGW